MMWRYSQILAFISRAGCVSLLRSQRSIHLISLSCFRAVLLSPTSNHGEITQQNPSRPLPSNGFASLFPMTFYEWALLQQPDSDTRHCSAGKGHTTSTIQKTHSSPTSFAAAIKDENFIVLVAEDAYVPDEDAATEAIIPPGSPKGGREGDCYGGEYQTRAWLKACWPVPARWFVSSITFLRW